MGKGGSKLRTIIRPAKNYNVEERAFKQISLEKTVAAPPYPNMQKIMESIKNDPELLNRGKPTDGEIKNLNQVFLKSAGDNPIIRTKVRLPESRTTPPDNIYGMEEPAVIPKGRITLRQTVELVGKHEEDKEKNNPETLAKLYGLDTKVTKDLLKNFKPFQIYMPPKAEDDLTRSEKVKKMLAKPFVPDKPRIKSR